MSSRLPSPLPHFDRYLLRAAEKLVPTAEREDWCRTWQAELWHARHRSRKGNLLAGGGATDLSVGLVCDALWLRTDSWRRALSGSAAFCLGSLLSLFLLSTFVALAINGSWSSMNLNLAAQFKRFLIEAPLLVFVNFAIVSRIYIEQRSAGKTIYWIKRRLFFAAKTTLVLLLAFLLSTDIFQPIHARLPNTSDLLQTFSFVLFALVGLRWALIDQEQRCKQCLRLLATPARVGRPSRNFLEWNGTELVCKHGHGLLSVPEMETSWCQYSQWLDETRNWDRAASI